MTRYLLRIEYEGGSFFGWQKQEEGPTVQGKLEAAATKLNGTETIVYGAGRTDAGVHARAQAAHIDLRDDLPATKIADALNYHLRPAPIAVLSAEPVTEDFHARFSATARHYRYVISNRRADLALQAGRAWRVAASLDAVAMNNAAQRLIGCHDFTTFRDTQCQSKSPVKTLGSLAVCREGDAVIITCSALSFLHKQVRSMAGSLVEVGRGQQPENWISNILDAKARAACGPVAPACGLYLERVDYPDIPSD